MINYDKAEIRKALTIDQIYTLLEDFGGEPEYTDYGILSATICHNPVGEGSKKLYYYTNTGLFQCYSNCGSFDPFELVIKVFNIQRDIDLDLNSAVRYVANKFGISGTIIDDDNVITSKDWEILNQYDRIQELEIKDYHITLEEYDDVILDRFNYAVKLTPWLKEGITQEVLTHNRIGFYPGGDQITIPHFDVNDRLIGVRGRTLCKEEAEYYGKYRPIIVNKQQYNHPLGMNLYNLNNSKNNIYTMGKAIVFESEKSSLLYQSYFGIENDISVACCGSNFSMYHMQLLLDAGAKEIIIAFDRQFQEKGDDEFKLWVAKLKKLNEKYKNFALISFIFDKNKITSYKASPIDEGPEKFLQLFKERIVI